MMVGIAVAVVSVCAGIGLLLYALSRHGAPLARDRSAIKENPETADPLDTREAFLLGIDQYSESGEPRQNLIRQCRPLEDLRLVAVSDPASSRQTITVHRADGADIGVLPQRVAGIIAEYLHNNIPVGARILAIEPCENEQGEILSGARIEITPHRMTGRH